MCGIAGIVTSQPITTDDLIQSANAIKDALKRRGPDAEGVLTFRNKQQVALIHTRLAILDLSENGNQPMTFDNENFIIYNGEIYNYKKIKSQLENEGVKFKTDTDTEVLLKGFLHKGQSILNELNGMFAFAIFNKISGDFFIARDRFGIKPLYYYEKQGCLIFGSNIQSIFNSKLVKKELNWEGLHSNFVFSGALSPLTSFKNINLLEPGHFITYKNKKLVKTAYYSILNQKVDKNLYKNDYLDYYEELIETGVKDCFVSDVPVGISLSGGIDSTLLATLAKAEELPFNSFTFGNSDNFSDPFSEESMARDFALDNNIHQVFKNLTANDILDKLEEILTIFEEPVSFIEPHYFIGELVKEKNQKVIISGLGPDEILLGYHRNQQLKKYYKHPTLKHLSPFIPIKSSKYKKLKDVVSANYLSQAYASMINPFGNVKFSELFINAEAQNSEIEYKKLHLNKSFNEEMSWLEFKVQICNHHALTTDKYLMHHGIEGRFPYLNHKLVEFQYYAPEKLKLKKPGKFMQRELASKYLSNKLMTRSKTGFQTPLNKAFQNETVIHYIKSKLIEINKFSVINKQAISTLLNKNTFTTNELNQIFYILSVPHHL